MRMQARGPGAGWSWLIAGFTVLRRHPGQIIGGAALLGLCLAVPGTVQLLAKLRGSALLVWMGLGMLCSGVFFPVLIGGFMRMLDANQNGHPVRVLMVFELFRRGQNGLRVALFGLCMAITYMVFLAIVLTTVGHGLLTWYLHLANQQALGTHVASLSPLPAGSSLALALLTVFFLFYSGALAIGIGQVALRGQAPLAGFRDGVAGAFKNVLPLVVLAVCGIVALVVFMVIVGIVVAILLVLGHFVSAVAGFVLAGLVYIAMLLLICAFMMGVNYAIWRDVSGNSQSGAIDAPLPSVQG